MPLGRYKDLLKSIGFQSFLWTQFLGAFNDNAFKIVLSMIAVNMAAGHGGAYVSMVGAVFILPFFLFSGYAGYAADVYNKRTVLIVTKAFEILAVLFGLVAFWSGRIEFMLGTLFLMALHSTFFSPAKYGILPEMLPDKELSRANGLLEMSTFLAIILGTSIPFLMYVVWEMIILGIIPLEGPTGLTAALKAGQNAVNPLGVHLNNPTLLAIGQIFAFFAMTTSFVGISIAFVDFLADGLKVQKKGVKKLGLCALIFLIPMFIAILDPKIFFLALNYAGGLGVALLLGAIPILMVWAGRYYQGHSLLHQQLPGGKILLSTLMVFVAVVLAITLIV